MSSYPGCGAGAKPGQQHAGLFKKGFDPRRNYGPKTSPEARTYYAKAREMSPAALDLLWEMAKNEDVETKERRLALQFIIEQGHGKAVDRTQIKLLTGNTSEHEVLSLGSLHERLAPIISGELDDDHEIPAEDAQFQTVEAEFTEVPEASDDHPL